MKTTGMCIKSHRVEGSQEINSGSDPRADDRELLLNKIRSRAYQLFEDRGRQPGRELDDWLRAEQETR
jgi:hypothetical protein